MQLSLFDEVAEALRGLVPPELGDLRQRARHYGIKVWFGPVAPTKEHYEAQVIGSRDVPEASVLALEVGFHAEHRDAEANDAVLAPLLQAERRWRRALGREACAGAFLGRQDDWRRISETWADPNLGEPGLAVEIATRLVDYMTALEPLRRAAR